MDALYAASLRNSMRNPRRQASYYSTQPNPSRTRDGDTSSPQILVEVNKPTHLTISDDRTDHSATERRNLSALLPGRSFSVNETLRVSHDLDAFQHTPRVQHISPIPTSLEPLDTVYEQLGKFIKIQDKSMSLETQIESNGVLAHKKAVDTETLKKEKTVTVIHQGSNHNNNMQESGGKGFESSFTPLARLNETIKHGSSQTSTKNDRLSTNEIQGLRAQMALLEAKLSLYESTSEAPILPKTQSLYRLYATVEQQDGNDVKEQKQIFGIYLDPPEVMYGQDGGGHLRCNLPLHDLNLFLAQHRDISFIVFRDYDRQCSIGNLEDGEMVHAPSPFSESIQPVATGLKEALAVLFRKDPAFLVIQNRYELTGEILAPYHFLYHSRRDLNSAVGRKLDPSARQHLDLFLEYIEKGFGDEYRLVDSLLKEKRILPKYLDYLFKPGDVIVQATGNNYVGYIAESWVTDADDPKINFVQMSDSRGQVTDIGLSSQDQRHGKRQARNMTYLKRKSKNRPPSNPKSLKAWTLNFDGAFSRSPTTLSIKVPSGKSSTSIDKPEEDTDPPKMADTSHPICSLNVFPLQYAPDSVINLLKRRGETFWKCRHTRLVSYSGKRSGQGVDMADERYMIDMESYKKLHSGQADPSSYLNPTRLISAELINKRDGKLQFLLPPYIKGYNLRHKKWFEISADGISDVKWNRDAFQSLVIERKSKELIQALVTSQLEAEKATDLIAGKGNGLILLLHGGPGTGKTLTAESVAEIAEKPLYRVTCGDVGTKAEDVEKYLESVLYLGRIWGCVVLLDEADVFLEQRSLEDLERNALVSVFLRVLEYYDGILILTSNRVGTFDEAFRSRIQLALHYPSLGPSQRVRIWQTFIDRLGKLSTDEEIDVDDLERHLDDLKDEKMNGRQIRNVITTARQYAKWKKEPLTYKYLKDVIEISGRFDTYLDKLHGGFSNDEIAQDDGLRLA